jgi:DNA polymerase-1
MPDRLQMQIERIQELLEAFNIPVLVADGYEADDVLGTAARLAGEQGVHTLIVTGDRDLLQLVNEHTTVQLPGRRTGEVDNYDPAAVLEKYGVTPGQIVDFKALTGDSSDNIPGVAGIGDKTATTLLQEYGTLDEVYANLESISSTRARNALTGSREVAYLSQQLAQIVTDVPIDFDLEACRPGEYDRDRVLELFQALEFRSLVKLIPGGEATPSEGQQLSLFSEAPAQAAGVEAVEPPTDTHVVRDEVALDALVERLTSAGGIAFDTETTSTDQMRAKLVGISLSVEPGEAFYIPVGHRVGDGPQLPLELVMDRLRPPMIDPDIPKYGHNIKYDAVIMEQHGLVVNPLSVDTMVGEWLLRPETSRGKLGLKAQAFIRLGIEMTEIEELIGSGRKQITFDLVPVERAAPYAGADADMTLRLVAEVERDLAEAGQDKLFYEVEMPLVPVLADMEQNGVLVDVDALREMSDEMAETIAEFQAQIQRIAGDEFNLNSTQQLSEVLFEKLRLPTEGLRKTKSGHYSTAADVLESLRPQDTTGVIEAILQYREAEKLKSTYLDALPALVNPQTGRIHSSFNQTGTVTGRISSSDPNLQNIPIRSEVGRRVRDAFIAAPGHLLLAADYSQVELRVLAHVSGDEALRQAFLDDKDIHATTAAAVNGVPLEEVTREQRSFAKAVNFGLLYGMGAFRLARDSGLTLPEAEEFIKRYFERFPKVRAYLDQTLEQAIAQGYVETLLGRRRYFPIFASQDRGRQASLERRAAEREAINMPIQGTAADIIKLAMIQLHDALRKEGLRSRMILQVHDELVLEVPEEEVDRALALVKEVMSSAYPLDVPLKVDAGVGQHWGEVK